MADRLLAQTLLEPVQQTIEEDILARQVGQDRRGVGE
jgi:hypothetical protein